MYDIDQYIEFNKSKYDSLKKVIKDCLTSNKNYIDVHDFNTMRMKYDVIDESCSLFWTDLVDYVSKIIDGIIDNNGTLITSNTSNFFTVPNSFNSAWVAFKNKLESKKIYSFEEIVQLEKSSIKILNNLSTNTYNSGPVKGLVMGYVQSGKTNSIESLITMGADWGFNVFIILSGIIENLRVQNMNRIMDDFGKEGESSIFWEFIDNPTKSTTPAYKILNDNKKIVLVSLKVSARLKNIKEWLFSLSDLSMSRAKILLIDDEADQAGLNTNDIKDDERSKINSLITDLIDNYTKSVGAMNYIGYTATPYGNFLNETNSIYPKDFIYMLTKSPKYIGSEEIFGDEEKSPIKSDGLDIKRKISDEDVQQLLSIEENATLKLPNSLKDAIGWFICTLAIFRLRNIIKPVTMLIHNNRKTAVHKNISDSINYWLNNCDKTKLLNICKNIYSIETNRFAIQNFYDVMDNYGRKIDDYPSFSEIEPFIEEIINVKFQHAKFINDVISYTKGIHSVIDNSVISKLLDESEQPRLIYPKKDSEIDFATGFIVIGGDTLSRGLTLEGLTTTYFCRNVSTVDTLMQMGRWFGYRIGYELLPRIWLDNNNLMKFEELTRVEIELRKDLEKYEIGESPLECGPVILSTFNTRITSKAKMQSAITYEEDYRGTNSQTIYYDKNINIQKYNMDLTHKFLGQFKFSLAYNNLPNLIAQNVNYSYVIDFLNNFKFCDKTSFFKNINGFCDWIANSNYENLKHWNIIQAGIGKISIDGFVGKVSRSKKSGYDDLNYINIGVLRNTLDLASDLNPKYYAVNMLSEKNVIDNRSKLSIPQLIIYTIDGNKSPDRISKNRESIDMNCDIIGLNIYIPGRKNKDYAKSITIQLDNGLKEGD